MRLAGEMGETFLKIYMRPYCVRSSTGPRLFAVAAGTSTDSEKYKVSYLPSYV